MKNQIVTILLLGLLSALVVGVGSLVAPGHLYLLVAIALAMNLGAYFFSDRIVLRMQGAREVPLEEAPGLHAVVEELAARADIPKPRVYLVSEEQPNAFATGRNPAHGAIAVTEGLLRWLEPAEVRGVLAHEIAHIKNRDILVASVAAAAGSVISYTAQVLSFGALFGGSNRDEEHEQGSGGGGILAMLVAPVVATLVQLAISRSREYLADETGARLCQDPASLARALVKLEQASQRVPTEPAPATASLFIVNPFGAVESAARWFSTHPATAERVKRLMAMAHGTAQEMGGMACLSRP